MKPQKIHSKLVRYIVVLIAFSAAYPITGYCAAAGRAAFVIGNVQAVAADGSSRTLRRGAVINAGDAIVTSARSRAQVRFTDGGFISLQPDTEFRVDAFEYQKDSKSEPKGFFSLLRGGLRAITGAIGKIKRKNYKVVTATATIGIRGTGYTAEIRDDGLFVSVGEGAISLTNNTGLYTVSTGNAAFVANINTAPAKTSQRPRTPPARIRPFISRITALKAELPRLKSGSGYTLAYSYIINGISPVSGINLLPIVTAQFNQLSRLDGYSDGRIQVMRGDAKSTFAATDGIIGWGRWVGNINPNGAAQGLLAPGIFHYVIGQATPLLKLPKGQASYSLMGYTNPSALNSNGWRVNDANLTADFLTSQVIVNMQLANASTTYHVNGVATITGPGFSGAGLFTSSPTAGACINSVCSTAVNGFFVGDNASRAGMSYEVQEVGTVSEFIQGATVFKRTANSTAPAGV